MNSGGKISSDKKAVNEFYRTFLRDTDFRESQIILSFDTTWLEAGTQTWLLHTYFEFSRPKINPSWENSKCLTETTRIQTKQNIGVNDKILVSFINLHIGKISPSFVLAPLDLKKPWTIFEHLYLDLQTSLKYYILKVE